MDLIQAMQERHSVRAYTDRPIEGEVAEKLRDFVRRCAGEQAKVLNYVIEHWKDMPEEMKRKRLNENLGHTLPQVIAGAVLGSVIGLAGPVIL